MSYTKGVLVAASLGTLFISSAAWAEDPPTTTTTTSASVSTTATAPTTAPAGAAKDDGTPDHERVIGRIGLSYFNVAQLPVGGAASAAGVARDNVSAPVIGARYWLNRGMGIDIGLGFGMTSGSTEVANGGTTTTVDAPSALGFALHGGVPLAFAHAKHYTFLAIPEVTVGFASRTTKFTGNPAPADLEQSGFKLDVGGRIGAEVYFGFIGIPELALNASVGLYARRESWKATQGPASASQGTFTLGTNVQSDPWAIFVNNISAIYYMP